MCCKKKNHEKCFCKFLSCIIGILFWMSVILFVAAIGSFIASFWFEEEWLDYKFWTETFGGCLTLWIISYNLKKFIDIETVKALGDLRTKLNDEKKKEIHSYLLPECDKKPIISCNSNDKKEENQLIINNVDLLDYIGTIELGAIMVKRGAITLDEFYNQFGYRVQNLIRNSDICNHLNNNAGYYDDLMYIVCLLRKEKKLDLSD